MCCCHAAQLSMSLFPVWPVIRTKVPHNIPHSHVDLNKTSTWPPALRSKCAVHLFSTPSNGNILFVASHAARTFRSWLMTWPDGGERAFCFILGNASCLGCTTFSDCLLIGCLCGYLDGRRRKRDAVVVMMGTNWLRGFFEPEWLRYLDSFDSGDQLKMIGVSVSTCFLSG